MTEIKNKNTVIGATIDLSVYGIKMLKKLYITLLTHYFLQKKPERI